jgi:stress response protein YsnF
MTRIVTAPFETYAQAEGALARLSAEVALMDSVIVGDGLAGTLKLDDLSISDEQRAACREQIPPGGFLLVAEVASEGAADAAMHALTGGGGPQGERDAAASPAGGSSAEEQRIPLLQEEIRIGKREVVRGGARVHAFPAEEQVRGELELSEEHTGIERRPANRRLSDEEVLKGGLLQERVVEISQMREEAVVSKEAFVHEELIVKKSVEHRVEQIEETVRHTEVEMERLQAQERPSFQEQGNQARRQ